MLDAKKFEKEYVPSCIEDYDEIVFADIEEYVRRKGQKQTAISKELPDIELESELL